MTHYENLSLQYISFSSVKNENFQFNNFDIFNILLRILWGHVRSA